MKTIKLLSLLILTVVVISCQEEDADESIPQTKIITEDHKDFLKSWEVNIDDVTIENIVHLDGISKEYLVSGDITIPMTEFKIWQKNKNRSKQYRSRYTVAPQHRTITILASNSGNGALTFKMRTALAQAVDNYNNLGTSLKFNLKYSGDNSEDMVVYRYFDSGAGGSAGFPGSNGRPYKWVRITSGADRLTVDALEHLMTHEIGHAVGLRHQDFRTRWTCGGEPAENGYIALIPGTPTSEREPSVMKACFSGNEDGEFTASDKKALKVLY